MRMEAPTPIYNKDSFLQQNVPVSGNYNLPRMYTGMLRDAKAKVKHGLNSVVDSIRDSYSSIKGKLTDAYKVLESRGSAKNDYTPLFAYR